MNHLAQSRFATLAVVAALLFILTSSANAQTTSFTYQGRLTDGGSAANGSYDLQFKLFDALTSGTQVGSTVTTSSVPVSNGIFTVTLDFGVGAFSGAARWLEISGRLAGGGAFVTLTPRQPVTSTPYTTKSLNATAADSLSAACNGCVSNAKLADGGVTNAKIADVAGNKLTGSIDTATLPAANVTGVLSIANGGTGSATQNFVDLTNTQTIGGAKTFSNTIAGNISGNAATATTTTNFSGSLAGDVTGIQTNTVVGRLRGILISVTAPTSGQVLKFNGTTNQYEPATDNNSSGTVTNVTASAPLTSSGGTTPNISLNSPLPIANGGTGISTSPASAGLFLRSSSSGAWGVAGLAAADLPGGSDNYIQSRDASSQTQAANFKISGSGILGFDLTVGRNLGTGGLAVDTGATFNGNFVSEPGLRFGNTGTLSGEGIASKRTGGGNQYGLDFYTGYTSRMAITNAGNVGIGTSSPGAALHVSSSGGLIFPQLLLTRTGNPNNGTWLNFAVDNSNSWSLAAFPNQLTFKSRNPGDVDILDLRSTGTDRITTSTGARLTSGGVWTNNSDRNLKHQFAAVNAREILAQVVKLPIQFWSYKAEDEKIRHLGPMAQDFAAAFHLGGSDKSIGTVDADGVALAAIQGLHQLVEEKQALTEQLQQQVQALRAQNQQLQQQLQRLQEMELKQQQHEIENLKKLVCLTHPQADVCRPAKAKN